MISLTVQGTSLGVPITFYRTCGYVEGGRHNIVNQNHLPAKQDRPCQSPSSFCGDIHHQRTGTPANQSPLTTSPRPHPSTLWLLLFLHSKNSTTLTGQPTSGGRCTEDGCHQGDCLPRTRSMVQDSACQPSQQEPSCQKRQDGRCLQKKREERRHTYQLRI